MTTANSDRDDDSNSHKIIRNYSCDVQDHIDHVKVINEDKAHNKDYASNLE